jgi:hypothetical protein
MKINIFLKEEIKMEILEKGKAFVKKHQKGILFVGGTILGIAVITVFRKPKIETVTKIELPEWADKWIDKCDNECLLYENGLPIFANDDQTAIYRDACEPSAISELQECGYEIVERA